MMTQAVIVIIILVRSASRRLTLHRRCCGRLVKRHCPCCLFYKNEPIVVTTACRSKLMVFRIETGQLTTKKWQLDKGKKVNIGLPRAVCELDPPLYGVFIDSKMSVLSKYSMGLLLISCHVNPNVPKYPLISGRLKRWIINIIHEYCIY